MIIFQFIKCEKTITDRQLTFSSKYINWLGSTLIYND